MHDRVYNIFQYQSNAWYLYLYVPEKPIATFEFVYCRIAKCYIVDKRQRVPEFNDDPVTPGRARAATCIAKCCMLEMRSDGE